MFLMSEDRHLLHHRFLCLLLKTFYQFMKNKIKINFYRISSFCPSVFKDTKMSIVTEENVILDVNTCVDRLSFLLAENKSKILELWMKYPIKQSTGAIVNFEDLLQVILYQSIDFCIMPTSLSLFGDLVVLNIDNSYFPALADLIHVMKNHYKMFFNQKVHYTNIGLWKIFPSPYLIIPTDAVMCHKTSSYAAFKYNKRLEAKFDRLVWVKEILRLIFETLEFNYESQGIHDIHDICVAPILNLYYGNINGEKSKFLIDMLEYIREMTRTLLIRRLVN